MTKDKPKIDPKVKKAMDKFSELRYIEGIFDTVRRASDVMLELDFLIDDDLDEEPLCKSDPKRGDLKEICDKLDSLRDYYYKRVDDLETELYESAGWDVGYLCKVRDVTNHIMGSVVSSLIVQAIFDGDEKDEDEEDDEDEYEDEEEDE